MSRTSSSSTNPSDLLDAVEHETPEESVPGGTPLNGVPEGRGQRDIPTKWVSYRVTTSSRDDVFSVFSGKKLSCVIGDETSKKGERHFHVVVLGHDHYETVKKRLQRLKLGRAKYWSEKNSGTFLGAVKYTIKDGDYYARNFNDWIALAENYVPSRVALPGPAKKDVESDWMLTYANILRVSYNWRRDNGIASMELGEVLRHMTTHSKWIPSPQMLKSGLDPWHFRMFRFRCEPQNFLQQVPDWWTPHSDNPMWQ